MDHVDVKIMLDHPDAQMPQYSHDGDSGMDIRSVEDVYLSPGDTKLVNTGIKVEIPNGYEIQMRTRSGYAVKGIFITNGVGTIDSTYRGTLKGILTNCSRHTLQISNGDRIAQLVLCKVEKCNWKKTNHLSESPRGEGGYGSTGIK